MVIPRSKVIDCLREFLRPGDQTHIERMTDLAWIAASMLEFGFECPQEKREELKEKFLKLIETLIEIKKETGTAAEKDQDEFLFSEELSIEDIAVICDVSHKLIENEKIPKEKILEWLKQAWDAGVHQQRIYSMEIEGSILNQIGVVINFGAGLAMHGVQQGLIPAN